MEQAEPTHCYRCGSDQIALLTARDVTLHVAGALRSRVNGQGTMTWCNACGQVQNIRPRHQPLRVLQGGKA